VLCSFAGHNLVKGSSQAVILVKSKSIFFGVSVNLMFRRLPPSMSDEDMTHTTLIGARNGVEEVQQGCPS
jgi:hypothetical protein